MRKIGIILSFILLILSSISITSAYSNNFDKKMENMSIEELQNIITESRISSYERYGDQDFVEDARTAWKAAGTILKKTGFPLTGELIIKSVNNENYLEVEGMFAKKIKKTSLYKDILSKGRTGGSSTFTRDMNRDLYFSIHTFSYKYYGDAILIKDKFDFEFDITYEDFGKLVGSINNFGYLMQHMGVFNPIKVNIYLYK